MDKNTLIISHETAKAHWLATERPDAKKFVAASQDVLDSSIPSAPLIQYMLNSHKVSSNSAVHCIVGQKAARRCIKGVSNHVCSFALPEKSLVRLDRQIYASSPELNFLQMAIPYSRPRLIEYGVNLCASYRVDYESRAIIKRNRPLTSVRQIEASLFKYGRADGKKVAQSCLPFIINGSASPMETKLYLLLCLPMRMGGYGLPTPVFNYTIAPGKRRRLTEQNWYVTDICWPDKKVIAEYDGVDYHQDISHDKRRINALESLGWRVLA